MYISLKTVRNGWIRLDTVGYGTVMARERYGNGSWKESEELLYKLRGNQLKNFLASEILNFSVFLEFVRKID